MPWRGHGEVMSCHVMSCNVMSCHVMLRQTTSRHFRSRHGPTPPRAACRARPHHATSKSHHVTSPHVTSCPVLSRAVPSRPITSSPITSRPAPSVTLELGCLLTLLGNVQGSCKFYRMLPLRKGCATSPDRCLTGGPVLRCLMELGGEGSETQAKLNVNNSDNNNNNSNDSNSNNAPSLLISSSWQHEDYHWREGADMRGQGL